VKVFRISLACLAACSLLAAAPAHAKTSNGLYEPFPSPESGGQAEVFVEGLAGSAGLIGLSGPDLQRGVLLQRGAVVSAGPASARGGAGASRFAPSFGWPLALLLLAVALGTTGVLAVRRA
jgi:hypothetical protein